MLKRKKSKYKKKDNGMELRKKQRKGKRNEGKIKNFCVVASKEFF